MYVNNKEKKGKQLDKQVDKYINRYLYIGKLISWGWIIHRLVGNQVGE